MTVWDVVRLCVSDVCFGLPVFCLPSCSGVVVPPPPPPACSRLPEQSHAVFTSLQDVFIGACEETKAEVVATPGVFLREDEVEVDENAWVPREGVMFALQTAAGLEAFPMEALGQVIGFIIRHGMSDESTEVRLAALNAANTFADTYGAGGVAVMLPVMDAFIEQGAESELAGPTEEHRDHQREGVVVVLGTLAKHLDADDPKVSRTVDTLLEALDTPSQAVQTAVAKCLPPLIKAVKHRGEEIVPVLLDKLLHGDTFGVRKGASYGLASTVKGLGLKSLKALNIMQALEAAAASKKDINAKQGALFAFENMCLTLGRLFEPYVIKIMPLLLAAFGDGKTSVREAAQGAARAIMRNLTGHGVKMVMPSLLAGLDEFHWRSKVASIVMLGSMAYCAPRQLAQCLPQIVPRLLTAFSDTHTKVRAAGKAALQDIGSVIRNPEIAALNKVLLSALTKPVDKTQAALDALGSTSFVHAIDPPSLALIVPIVERALGFRSTATKKSAALIVGNMLSLIADPKDIMPYLDMLVPQLRATLVDPIPNVRAEAARALGALVHGLGESEFVETLAWLQVRQLGHVGLGWVGLCVRCVRACVRASVHRLGWLVSWVCVARRLLAFDRCHAVCVLVGCVVAVCVYVCVVVVGWQCRLFLSRVLMPPPLTCFLPCVYTPAEPHPL